MGRYRKIDPRMYGDEKFRRLSKPQPNAQTLFHYLFTGPHTTNVPGLYAAGEAQLAEGLGWTLRGFRAAWEEVRRVGLAQADWEARVVWVANVIKYDPPESPSVVKSWATPLSEIPECNLKWIACEHLRARLTACGPAWAAAWPSGLAQGVPHPEPEPDPDPEPESPLNPPRGATPQPDYPTNEQGQCTHCVAVLRELRSVTGRKYRLNGKPIFEGLHARHQESSVEICLEIVRVKSNEWLDDAKMEKFIRPSTLFGPKNFVEYRAEAEAAMESGGAP